jgi:macrodomain Ter protein organizer (MatP/YcbG family)
MKTENMQQKEPRKEIEIEQKVYRKVERCAKNKNMTPQEYIDFLFHDWPRKLNEEETKENLRFIFTGR